jgi:hypothetical protein
MTPSINRAYSKAVELRILLLMFQKASAAISSRKGVAQLKRGRVVAGG